MNAGTRAYVFARDGMCVIAKLDLGHRCYPPDSPEGRLTIGHVREHPGGMRRDDEGWLITQCYLSNLRHDESRLASEVRAYLLGVRAESGMHR